MAWFRVDRDLESGWGRRSCSSWSLFGTETTAFSLIFKGDWSFLPLALCVLVPINSLLALASRISLSKFFKLDSGKDTQLRHPEYLERFLL